MTKHKTNIVLRLPIHFHIIKNINNEELQMHELHLSSP